MCIRDRDKINIYAFMDIFSRKLPEKTVTVVANGSASVVGSAAYVIKKDSRFIMNCALSSMGLSLIHIYIYWKTKGKLQDIKEDNSNI